MEFDWNASAQQRSDSTSSGSQVIHTHAVFPIRADTNAIGYVRGVGCRIASGLIWFWMTQKGVGSKVVL